MFEKAWTIESYLGYLYSTAFALPSFLGENCEISEADLRASLLAVELFGQLIEEVSAALLMAWKDQ